MIPMAMAFLVIMNNIGTWIWFEDCFGNRYGQLLQDVLRDENYIKQQSSFMFLYSQIEALRKCLKSIKL